MAIYASGGARDQLWSALAAAASSGDEVFLPRHIKVEFTQLEEDLLARAAVLQVVFIDLDQLPIEDTLKLLITRLRRDNAEMKIVAMSAKRGASLINLHYSLLMGVDGTLYMPTTRLEMAGMIEDLVQVDQMEAATGRVA